MSAAPRIADLRRTVLERVASVVEPRGFEPAAAGQWCRRTEPVWRSVAVNFLDARHAATFHTTTASFGVEVGVRFDDPAPEAVLTGAPEPWRCDLRIALRRDFRQEPPSPQLPEPDRRRRDLWWIDRSGAQVDAAAESAARVVLGRGMPLLRRFADPRRAVRTLRWSPGRGWFSGEPFNLGRRGSPYRRELITRLENVIAGG